MPEGASTAAFLLEVIRRTPAGVWVILAALLVIGAVQLREQTLGRRRVLLSAALLASLSIAGLLAAFRLHGLAWLAWVAGGVAVYAIVARTPWPRRVRYVAGHDAFVVGGSVVPLAAMFGMFAVFYVLNVALALHPEWKLDGRLALAAGAAYGVLPGLLLARARRILASARAAGD